MRILIMGNSGAGKSYLVRCFKKRGLPTIDRDNHAVSGWFEEKKKSGLKTTILEYISTI